MFSQYGIWSGCGYGVGYPHIPATSSDVKNDQEWKDLSVDPAIRMAQAIDRKFNLQLLVDGQALPVSLNGCFESLTSLRAALTHTDFETIIPKSAMGGIIVILDLERQGGPLGAKIEAAVVCGDLLSFSQKILSILPRYDWELLNERFEKHINGLPKSDSGAPSKVHRLPKPASFLGRLSEAIVAASLPATKATRAITIYCPGSNEDSRSFSLDQIAFALASLDA